MSRSTALKRMLGIGIKYGPIAYASLRRTKAPAPYAASRPLARRGARALALEHADHLLDGSILPVFDGDTRVWVVFSGDEAIGCHPAVSTPLEQLLAHADLSKRLTPAEAKAARRKRIGALPGKRGTQNE